MRPQDPLFFIAIVLSTIPLSISELVNVTIDDSYCDPTTGQQFIYSPISVWNIGQNCTSCMAHVSQASTYGNTWHDGTFLPPTGNDNGTGILSASVSFFGSAVYVFCIVTGSSVSPDSTSDMQFRIDDELVGSFNQSPNGRSAYNYSVPVYVNTTLTPANHTFTLESGHQGREALVLLDYLVYTTDFTGPMSNLLSSSSPSPSSNSVSALELVSLNKAISTSQTPSPSPSSAHKSMNTGAIIGGVVGGLAISSGVLILVILRKRGIWGGTKVDTLPREYNIELNPTQGNLTETRASTNPEALAQVQENTFDARHDILSADDSAGLYSGFNASRLDSKHSSLSPPSQTRHGLNLTSTSMASSSTPTIPPSVTRWLASSAARSAEGTAIMTNTSRRPPSSTSIEEDLLSSRLEMTSLDLPRPPSPASVTSVSSTRAVVSSVLPPRRRRHRRRLEVQVDPLSQTQDGHFTFQRNDTPHLNELVQDENGHEPLPQYSPPSGPTHSFLNE